MSGDSKQSCPAQSSEDAIKWAEENGLDVLLPKPNQLFIDLDDPYDRQVFEQNRDLIDDSYGISEFMVTTSRSGGKHLTVNLMQDITPLERVALQAVLGSDRRREAHSLRRLLQGEKNPTLFFEKK